MMILSHPLPRPPASPTVATYRNSPRPQSPEFLATPIPKIPPNEK